MDLEKAEAPDRRPSPVASDSLMVKTAVETTYPTDAARIYYCQVQTAAGDEAEGNPGDFLHALNLGTAIPPVGTLVEVTFTPDFWVFRYDG